MNSAMSNLFNDIFSNAFNFAFPADNREAKLDIQLEQFWGVGGRLVSFFDHFKATDDGKDFERWLPFQYSIDDFIKEYKRWFSFYYYFQFSLNRKKDLREDNVTLDEFQIHFDQRLILFQPLFLTLPFIFYLKRVLKINYFYVYFVDFNEPSVYSVFKELKNFKCYFPWYSGFTLLGDFAIEKGIDKSNEHLEKYIKNFIRFTKINIPFLEWVSFINLNDLTKETIFHNSDNIDDNLSNKILEILKNKRVQLFENYITGIKKIFTENNFLHKNLFFLVLLNNCFQDILDKLLEYVREKDLTPTNKIFTQDKLLEIMKKNAHMQRPNSQEKEYNEDVYYYSPETDLFAFHKIINKDYPDSVKPWIYQFLKKTISNNQDINRNLMLSFLYHLKKYDGGKANIEILKMLEETFKSILKDKFSNTKPELEEFLAKEKNLKNINSNFMSILSPFIFRNNIEKEFARFDYGFIGLRMSDLRYILDSRKEFRNQSDVFYEIHGVFSFLPLETVSNELARKRNFRVKNFIGSFIDVFATKIVSQKMSNLERVRQLEIENNKERSIAHLMKSLLASMVIYMDSIYEEDKKIAIEISWYLSYYFRMRQLYSYHPINEDESLYIDFITFLEFLLIENFVIHDGNIRKYERYDEILLLIIQYLKFFFEFSEADKLKDTDFQLMHFPIDLKDHFFQNTGCLKLKYRNENDLLVKINVSEVIEKFSPLLLNFTELIRNASRHRGNAIHLNLFILKNNDNHYLIFSKYELTTETARNYFEKSQPLEEFLKNNQINGFGLKSIDYYISQHHCRLRLFREKVNDDFITIINVLPGSNLFQFIYKKEVKK